MSLIALSAWVMPVDVEAGSRAERSVMSASEDEYSIVLLPDTQYYVSQNPDVFKTQTRWIADNHARLNIAYVAGLGDITNLGDGAAEEWAHAWAAISILEDSARTGLAQGVSYGLAVGNHDQSPMDDHAGTTNFYNQYFGVDHFRGRAWYGGSYDASNDSHHDLIDAGGLKFIIIHLEHGATYERALLDWADALLQSNRERVGILVSHYLLEPEGTFSTEGECIYNALKTNDNLALLIGGHNWSEAHRADTFNGHTIYTIMADFSNRTRGGDGWLQILTFKPALNQMQVTTYSPLLDQFETDAASEFVLPLDLGLVRFDATDVPVPVEPVFHIADIEAATILNGAQDLVAEQASETAGAIQYELSDAAAETQQGWLDAMTPTDLDEYIESQMSKHGLKGVALVVASGTEIVYLKGYGTAGNDRPMTPQTPMYIGSQSKSFTGLAIAQLIEQGKINPNDPVQKYIPWFKVADNDASKRITVNHLIHHTSGLSDAGFNIILPDNAANEDAVRALASAELTAPVGAKHQYFNVGYDVLAVIVQNVSGLKYEEYVQKNIFDPLGMTHTYTDPALARTNGLSQGYSRFFGFTVPRAQPHRNFEVSAGYIISSAEDMAHYAIAMNNAGMYQDTRVLSRAGMDALFAPVQGYGMGWFIEQGHIYHGGANETFKTYVDLYLQRDLGIVLLINQGYMVDHFISAEQLFNGVEAIVLGHIPPPLTAGWSVKYMGWALGLFVLVLAVFQTRNLLSLRTWRDRAKQWSTGKKIFDIAISFIIPTVILVVVFSQVKAFWGDRFNLSYQLLMMSRALTDITVLMIVGSVPDYVQGLVKLIWVMRK